MFYFNEEGGFYESDKNTSLKGLSTTECERLIEFYEGLVEHLEENDNTLQHGVFTGYGKNASGPVTGIGYYYDDLFFEIGNGTYYGNGVTERLSDQKIQSIKNYLEKIKSLYRHKTKIQSIKKLIFR